MKNACRLLVLATLAVYVVYLAGAFEIWSAVWLVAVLLAAGAAWSMSRIEDWQIWVFFWDMFTLLPAAVFALISLTLHMTTMWFALAFLVWIVLITGFMAWTSKVGMNRLYK